MAQHRWGIVLVVLLLLIAVGFASTNTSDIRAAAPPVDAPQATATVPTSKCLVGASKWVAPTSIILGQTADVSLVFTHTCPSLPLPIDMVIVVDESYSMTRGKNPIERPTEKVTPDPSAEPSKMPTGEGVGRCEEPPFCGGGRIETALPTATNTRVWPPRPTSIVDPTVVPTMALELAGSEDNVREAQNFVRDFVGSSQIEDDMRDGRLRIGFVSFNRRAKVKQALSSDPGDILSSIGRVKGDDITKITDGLREATNILDGKGARTGEDRIKVVMLVSDFEFCSRDVKKLANDITFISVGFGVHPCDADKLSRMATSRKYVFQNARANQVVKAYTEDLVRGARSLALADLDVVDEIHPDLSLVLGSIQPPTATLAGQMIQWPLPQPVSPITLTYSVRPDIDGDLLVSTMAEAHFTDTQGIKGVVPFPEVRLQVVAHTPTPTSTYTVTPSPTSTATSTSTATPTPRDCYLPIVRKHWPSPVPSETPLPTPTECKPELQTIDVALVVDTSTSMNDRTRAGGQPKLTAAIEAARTLVNLLKAEDQTAVVGFNASATLLAGLTSDRSVVHGALDRLPGTQASGTNIYSALESAHQELIGARHRSGYNRSIVLVTDGIHNDPVHSADDVRALAERIRADDIEIVTVGLGSEIDGALLAAIASSPDYYFAAPDAAELQAIYTEIAHLIPCP